ncbi:MAG: M15 family peptidase [Methylocystaceae bacterium]|nr:M15 family peptidase [Methylocystaceae bacterium]
MSNAWPLQRECLAKFGNPYAPGWGNTHVTHVNCPWQLHMGPLHIPYIKVNKIAADSLGRVLNHVWDWSGKDPEKIASIHADQFSGDWVIRQMRGLKSISMHSYALAIDFDAPHNQLGSRKHFFQESNPLIKAFLDEGWIWGGSWSRPDAMHVQAARIS